MQTAVSFRTKDWIALGGILLVIVAVFGQAIGFSFVNWDDEIFVLHQNVQNWFELSWQQRLATSHAGYPVPIPTAVHGWLHHFFGADDASIFHLVNIVVHAVNAVLVFVLLRRLDIVRLVATVCTLLWALHPVMAEPVAWVTGLKDLLSMTGVLLALLGMTWLRDNDMSLVAWAMLIMGPLLAIGGKPTGVVVGPMMLAFVVVCRTGFERKQLGIGLGTLWTLVGTLMVFWSFQAHDEYGGQDTEAFSVGRIFRALETTLQNYVAPLNLGPTYSFHPPTVATYAIGIGVVVIAGLLVWKNRERRPVVSLGLIWAGLAYGPVSNLVPLNRFVADSYLYTPTLGFVVALGGWATTWSSKRSGVLRRLGVGLGVFFLAVLCAFQVSHWNDSISLWERSSVVSADDPMTYLKLGQAYYEQDRYGEAIEAFEHLEAEFPEFEIDPPRWPMAYCAVGEIERCEELLIEFVVEGPREQTLPAQRDYDYAIASYAWMLHQTDRTMSDRIPEELRARISETREAFERGAEFGDILDSSEGRTPGGH